MENQQDSLRENLFKREIDRDAYQFLEITPENIFEKLQLPRPGRHSRKILVGQPNRDLEVRETYYFKDIYKNVQMPLTPEQSYSSVLPNIFKEQIWVIISNRLSVQTLSFEIKNNQIVGKYTPITPPFRIVVTKIISRGSEKIYLCNVDIISSDHFYIGSPYMSPNYYIVDPLEIVIREMRNEQLEFGPYQYNLTGEVLNTTLGLANGDKISHFTPLAREFVEEIRKDPHLPFSRREYFKKYYIGQTYGREILDFLLLLLMSIKTYGGYALFFSLSLYFSHFDIILLTVYEEEVAYLEGFITLMITNWYNFSDETRKSIEVPQLKSHLIGERYYYDNFIRPRPLTDPWKMSFDVFVREKYKKDYIDGPSTSSADNFFSNFPFLFSYEIAYFMSFQGGMHFIHNVSFIETQEKFTSCLREIASVDYLGFQNEFKTNLFLMADSFLENNCFYSIDDLYDIAEKENNHIILSFLATINGPLINVFMNSSRRIFNAVINYYLSTGTVDYRRICRFFCLYGTRWQYHDMKKYIKNLDQIIESIGEDYGKETDIRRISFSNQGFFIWNGNIYASQSNEFPNMLILNGKEKNRLITIGKPQPPVEERSHLFSLSISPQGTTQIEEIPIIPFESTKKLETLGGGGYGEINVYGDGIIKTIEDHWSFTNEVKCFGMIKNVAISNTGLITAKGIISDNTHGDIIYLNRGTVMNKNIIYKEFHQPTSPSYREDFRIKQMFQLVYGVYEMLTAGFHHLDIKPDNIIMFENEHGEKMPKIIDFGISRFTEGLRQHEPDQMSIITTMYRPPEISFSVASMNHIDYEKADVWSLACVIHSHLSPYGYHPYIYTERYKGKRILFYSDSYPETYTYYLIEKIFDVKLKDIYPKIDVPNLSKDNPKIDDNIINFKIQLREYGPPADALPLLRKMLAVDYEERIRIRDVLAHEFFASHNTSFRTINYDYRTVLHWQLGQQIPNNRSFTEKKRMLTLLRLISPSCRWDNKIIYKILRIYEMVQLPLQTREDVSIFLLGAINFLSEIAAHISISKILTCPIILNLFPFRELEHGKLISNSFTPSEFKYETRGNLNVGEKAEDEPNKLINLSYRDMTKTIMQTTKEIFNYLSPYDIAVEYYTHQGNDLINGIETEFLELLDECYLNGLLSIFNSCQIAAGLVYFLHRKSQNSELSTPLMNSENEYMGKIVLLYIKELMAQGKWLK